MYATDPDAKKVMDVAKGIEGLRRQDGIHAAAVVITKGPLTDSLPIQRKPESGGNPEDAPVVTQFEGGTCEDLGLLKMDFLGLRNLDVISDALELISEHRGVDVDIDNVALDDPPTFAMLAKGETIGVFQLESPPMRALIRAVAPDSFEDVANRILDDLSAACAPRRMIVKGRFSSRGGIRLTATAAFPDSGLEEIK